MKKIKLAIFLVYLISFFIALNGYITAQPTKKQLVAFRSEKTVQLVVNQSYSNAKGAYIMLDNLVREILKYAGINTVISDSEDYSLKLIIELKGEAISARYTYGQRYTGARISGSINLVYPRVAVYKKDFSGHIHVSMEILGITKYSSPSDAPFWDACMVKDSFLSKLFEIMAEIYGPDCLLKATKEMMEKYYFFKIRAIEVFGKIGDTRPVEFLITALDDKNKYTRQAAVLALGKIGDTRAVEPLIARLVDKSIRGLIWDALGDLKDPRGIEPLINQMKKIENKYTRRQIGRALRKITKKNFRGKTEKWQKWWEENKDKYLKKK